MSLPPVCTIRPTRLAHIQEILPILRQSVFRDARSDPFTAQRGFRCVNRYLANGFGLGTQRTPWKTAPEIEDWQGLCQLPSQFQEAPGVRTRGSRTQRGVFRLFLPSG